MSPISFVGSAMVYTGSELVTATKNFNDNGIIGTGGFGVVFQGRIRHCLVAVKRLTEVSISQGHLSNNYIICFGLQRGVNMLRGTVDSQLQTEISALTR